MLSPDLDVVPLSHYQRPHLENDVRWKARLQSAEAQKKGLVGLELILGEIRLKKCANRI
jgi:hypothetical protein